MKANQAEVHYSQDGGVPRVELVIPHGTRFQDIVKIQEVLERKIIGKISPRGCETCLSGVVFNIREQLEHVLTIDLLSGKVI